MKKLLLAFVFFTLLQSSFANTGPESCFDQYHEYQREWFRYNDAYDEVRHKKLWEKENGESPFFADSIDRLAFGLIYFSTFHPIKRIIENKINAKKRRDLIPPSGSISFEEVKEVVRYFYPERMVRGKPEVRVVDYSYFAHNTKKVDITYMSYINKNREEKLSLDEINEIFLEGDQKSVFCHNEKLFTPLEIVEWIKNQPLTTEQEENANLKYLNRIKSITQSFLTAINNIEKEDHPLPLKNGVLTHLDPDTGIEKTISKGHYAINHSFKTKYRGEYELVELDVIEMDKLSNQSKILINVNVKSNFDSTTNFNIELTIKRNLPPSNVGGTEYRYGISKIKLIYSPS